MSALCYVLGVVAKMNSSMWRFRINFLPINVLLIGLMGVGGFATLDSAMDGLRNARSPVRVSLAQIRDNPDVTQSYVTVTGLDFPVAFYEYGTKGDNGEMKSVDKSWSPLLDRESRRFLLVQKAGRLPGGEPHEATLTGMLRVMDNGVRQGLSAQNDAFEGVPVETRYMLVAGEYPGDVTTNLVLTAILFGVVGLFAIATAKRNTIFQVSGHVLAAAAGPDPLKVRATGTFRLDQEGRSIRQRFIQMPAILAQLDNGAPALLSNIDASNRFMGITTSKRAGIWSIAIEPGSVRDAQVGYVYWGTSRQRALRFTYTEAGARTPGHAIIAAADEAAVGAGVTVLTSGTLSAVGHSPAMVSASEKVPSPY